MDGCSNRSLIHSARARCSFWSKRQQFPRVKGFLSMFMLSVSSSPDCKDNPAITAEVGLILGRLVQVSMFLGG